MELERIMNPEVDTVSGPAHTTLLHWMNGAMMHGLISKTLRTEVANAELSRQRQR